MGRSRSAPRPAARSASSASERPRPAAQAQPIPTSSSAFSSSPRPAAPQYAAPSPMHSPGPAAPPAMQQSGGGGMFSGLMGSMVTGMAMGTGSAVAHRAVDGLMGPRTVVHEHQDAPAAAAPMAAAPMGAAPSADGPCSGSVKTFAECMSRYNGDMGACQEYFNAMQQCKVHFNMA